MIFCEWLKNWPIYCLGYCGFEDVMVGGIGGCELIVASEEDRVLLIITENTSLIKKIIHL